MRSTLLVLSLVASHASKMS
ncbi:unnamed protein product, partial [Rotaria sp. Silwood1]